MEELHATSGRRRQCDAALPNKWRNGTQEAQKRTQKAQIKYGHGPFVLLMFSFVPLVFCSRFCCVRCLWGAIGSYGDLRQLCDNSEAMNDEVTVMRSVWALVDEYRATCL